MLVDSHCHLNLLDLTEVEGGLDKVIAEARENNIEYLLSICTNLEQVAELLTIANNYHNISISVGVHPNVQVVNNPTNDEEISKEPSFAELKNLASKPKVIAIGETGLDYYRMQGDLTWQRDRFARHIEIAKELAKPLIIHTRDAFADTIDMLKTCNAEQVGGVIHCFTEDWTAAKQALDLGFYISFSGIVTFKSATEIQEAARKVPLDRMLVETDCPYLAPVPFRGKQNFPKYVSLTAEFIAKLRNTELAEIAKATTDNFYRLFKIKTKD